MESIIVLDGEREYSEGVSFDSLEDSFVFVFDFVDFSDEPLGDCFFDLMSKEKREISK